MYSHTSHQIDCCRAVAFKGFLSRRWRGDAAGSLIRSRKGNDFLLRGFPSVSDWGDKTGCGHTACGLMPCLCFLYGDHLPDKDEDGKHPAKARRGEGTQPVLLSPSIFSIFYKWNNVYRCLLQGTPATAGDVKLTFRLERKPFPSSRTKQFAINSVSLETTAVVSNTISVN